MSRYKIQKTIGEGNYGTVFAARDDETGGLVAIKILKPADADTVERFEREAKVLCALDHPGIVKVLGTGVANGKPYTVMELLDGKPLDVLHRKARLTPAQIVGIAVKVAEALDYAHGRGIVHRDVKPANIFVTRANRIKLLDFGMARWLEPGASITDAGVYMGTPDYIAPEVIEGQRPVPASDLYSLAAMMFVLLAGQAPFTAANKLDAMLLRLERVAPTLAEKGVRVPEVLERLIARGLARKPADRHGSLREFAKEARAALKALREPSS